MEILVDIVRSRWDDQWAGTLTPQHGTRAAPLPDKITSLKVRSYLPCRRRRHRRRRHHHHLRPVDWVRAGSPGKILCSPHPLACRIKRSLCSSHRSLQLLPLPEGALVPSPAAAAAATPAAAAAATWLPPSPLPPPSPPPAAPGRRPGQVTRKEQGNHCGWICTLGERPT